MFDRYIPHWGFRDESACEFGRTLKGEYCAENGELGLDGLRLCLLHADRLRLEERVAYWRAMLAHSELWSGEARARGREDMVRLLDVERARASAALERAYEGLRKSRGGEGGDNNSGISRQLLPPLFLLGLAVAG